MKILLILFFSFSAVAMTDLEKSELKERFRVIPAKLNIFIDGYAPLNIQPETNPYSWLDSVLNGDTYANAVDKITLIEQESSNHMAKINQIKSYKTILKNSDCSTLGNATLEAMCGLMQR